MVSNGYYLAFSIAGVVVPLIYLVNIIYVKKRQRTLLGVAIKPGSPEHALFMKAAAGRRLAVAIFIGLAAIANLVYCVYANVNQSGVSYTLEGFSLVALLLTVVIGGLIIWGRMLYSDKMDRKK